VKTALDKKTGEYLLRDPQTGEIRGFDKQNAARLMADGEWSPVTMEEAEPYYDEAAARRVVGAGEGIAEGVYQGLGGGIVDLGIEPGSSAAKGILSVAQGAPAAHVAGEVAGTVMPFMGPLKAGKLLTAPGLLEAGGEALTKGLRRGAPGIARTALSRAAGVGGEVSGQLALEEARRAHLEARPANFSRVLGGYGLGAMVPALVLGTGVGVLEGGAMTLGQRALVRGKKARELALKAGIDDPDVVNILHREGKLGTPGAMDEFHAQKAGMNVKEWQLMNDPGPAGDVYRQRMMEAPDARVETATDLASRMNRIRDIDDDSISMWSGRMKPELAKKLIPDHLQTDAVSTADRLRGMFSRSGVDTSQFPFKSADPRVRDFMLELDANPAALEEWVKGAHPPTIEVSAGGEITWKSVADGRHRITAAARSGYDDMPVVVRRYGDGAPTETIERINLDTGSEALKQEIAVLVAQQVKNKTDLGKKLMNELALGKGMDVRTAIMRGLEAGDESVLRAVSTNEFDTAMMRTGGGRWAKFRDRGGPGPTWHKEASNLLRDIEEKASMLELEGKGYVGNQHGKLKEIEELVQGVRGRLSDMDRPGAAMELDYLKKRLNAYTKSGEQLGAGDRVAYLAREQYDAVKDMLENPMHWGEKFATAQRETNALLHKRIAREGPFYKGWFKDSGVPDPRDPRRNQMEATPDSVMNVIGDVTDIRHEGAAKWREHIAETKEVLENRLKNFDNTPEEIAKIQSDLLEVDGAIKSFDATIAHNALANNAAKLRGANAGWGAGFAVRSLVGHAIGGLPGAVAGAYLTNKLNPAASIVARGHLERILRQNEARVERAVARLVKGETVPSLGVAQAATRLADEPREKKQEGYQKSIKELYAAAQDPSKAAEVIGKELEGMDEHMPGVTEQARVQAVNGMRYAYDHAPAKPITTLMDGEFISPVSDIELHAWELLAEAAMDPTSILEQAADGELTPEAVDAAEAVAPEFVAELRMEIIDQIADQELSYEQGVALSTLFKMPVDMTTTPEYIRTQQMLYAARAQSSGPKPNRSFNETGVHKTSTMSKSDQLASGVPPS